ncbi:MAG: deoxyribodipyrimidine photo-lyase [Pseudomonadales bacterium]|jgi:deoxyribodipyrimidine photo-lyase
MSQLVWFRNDLRTHDNPALSTALETNTPVSAVYVEVSQQHAASPHQRALKMHVLRELNRELAELGVTLQVCSVGTFQEAAQAVVRLATHHNCSGIYANRDCGIHEYQRDQYVSDHFSGNVSFYGIDTVQPLGSITTGQGTMFKVFTPFKRAWLSRWNESLVQPIRPTSQLRPIAPSADVEDFTLSQLTQLPDVDVWLNPEQSLQDFVQLGASQYDEQRDFPAIEGTSKLSPHLAIGAISIQSCVRSLLRGRSVADLNDGESVWLSELIWRDFYRHLMFAYPDISKNRAFQPYTDLIHWDNSEEHFQAWCEGKTGFPIVDAAMRCLNSTGWMHNRLRMVVASFLCKDLMIDWRWGEGYFMSVLIDGDFASNNGGWQWAASAGADAAPYFRIFNPIRQSQRFDVHGEFIRTWIPELRELPDKAIHEPHAWFEKNQLTANYCSPIIDRSKSKDKVLTAFAHAKEKSVS